MEENIDKGDEPRSKLRSRQLLTALSPLLSVFVFGLTYGFTSVIMLEIISPPREDEENSASIDDLKITRRSEVFWIAPGNILPMIPSSWLSGVLMELIGRRKLLVVAFPLFIIGWLVIGFANSIRCLTIGRLICGVPAGLIGPLVPVYIGEISDPAFRGVSLSIISAIVLFGMLTANLLGILMHWRGNAYVYAAVSLIGWLTCIVCRESPIWLMNRGQSEQALKQWVHLRGWESLDEYRAMEHATKTRSERNRDNGSYGLSRLAKTLSSAEFLWPLAASCVLNFTWQFSGFNVAGFFVVYETVLVVGYRNVKLANVIVTVIMFIVAVAACFLMFKFNRRALAMVSGIGAICSLLWGSFFFAIEARSVWISNVCLLFLLIFVTMGLQPLSWMFMGESFPRKLRSLGAGLASGFSSACYFADVKMAAKLVLVWQPFEILILYGVLALVGSIILYWKLPETKDKTLLEIETIFHKKDSYESDPADVEMMERRT